MATLFYWVKDNGVGFDMEKCQETCFGVFSENAQSEWFSREPVSDWQTVQRIIHRHDGHHLGWL